MAWQITEFFLELADQNKQHLPGETISGNINLSVRAPLPIYALKLRFLGIATISVQGTFPYKTPTAKKVKRSKHQKCCLFENNEILLDETEDQPFHDLGIRYPDRPLPTGKHSIPFKFTLPKSAKLLPNLESQTKDGRELCKVQYTTQAFLWIHPLEPIHPPQSMTETCSFNMDDMPPQLTNNSISADHNHVNSHHFYDEPVIYKQNVWDQRCCDKEAHLKCTICFSIPTKRYTVTPDSSIPVSLDIANQSGTDIRPISVCLKETYTGIWNDRMNIKESVTKTVSNISKQSLTTTSHKSKFGNIIKWLLTFRRKRREKSLACKKFNRLTLHSVPLSLTNAGCTLLSNQHIRRTYHLEITIGKKTVLKYPILLHRETNEVNTN